MKTAPDFASLMECCKKALAMAKVQGREAALQEVCRLLAAGVPHYNWVGFYVVDASGQALDLGPFVGAPTEHVKIPFGRGICGQAAATGETFIVQDVSKETNYLSCSLDVKSEVVLPIFAGGKIAAELDIDSHELSPFSHEDRRFLEELCTLLGPLFEKQ